MDGAIGHVISQRSVELCNIGSKAYVEGKFDVAYLHFMAALVADDKNFNAWMNLGAVLSNMQKSVASEVACRRALALDPDDPGKLNNLANGIVQQRRYAEGIAIYDKVLSSRPDDAGVHHNIGMAYYHLQEFAKAEVHLEKSVELRDNVAANRNDLAMTKLALGKLVEGLADFEVRWATLHKCNVWDSGVAEWKGEPLGGKSILIHHEQGFGDSIMLSRLIKDVFARGARVTIAVPKELILLFRHNFPLCTVLDWDAAVVAKDYAFHSPMLSLLRWLEYSDHREIRSSPYLTNPGTFDFEAKGKIKIGLCWASGDHGFVLQKRRRVIALEKFLPLAALPDVRLYSLQKGPETKSIEYTGGQALIYDALARAEDFADTADVIAQLDLVVSVDSAVAHLAGAMGKPVIMLSPFPRCWRWWAETDGMPWYRDMAIVQQTMDGGWDDAVAEALALVSEWFL